MINVNTNTTAFYIYIANKISLNKNIHKIFVSFKMTPIWKSIFVFRVEWCRLLLKNNII